MLKKYFRLHLLSLFLLIGVAFFVIHSNNSLTKFLKAHWDESSHTFEQEFVNSKLLPPELKGTVDNDTSISNSGRDTFYMCKGGDCKVTYSIKSPKTISKVSIYFIDQIAKKYHDVGFELDNEVINENNIRSNCSISQINCDYYFKSNKQSSTISVILKDAAINHFGIYEIQFFGSRQNNIFLSIFNYLFIWPRSLFSYALYPVLFFIIFLIPGLIYADLIKKKRKLDLIEVLFISIVILSILAFINFVLPGALLKLLIALELIYFAHILFKNRSYVRDLIKKQIIILVIFIASIVFLSGIMFIRDNPKTKNNPIYFDDFYAKSSIPNIISYATYETDFLIPYQTAINLKKGGKELQKKIGIIYTFSDRTPLISILLLLFTKAFGQRMFIYQMFTVTFANLFIIAVYFIAKKFTNEVKSAAISSTLAFSHFFIFISTYWPQKTIALFFIFSSLYYIFKSRSKYFIAGVHILIAYFLHMYAIVYSLSFSLFIFFKEYFSSRRKFAHAFKLSISYLIASLIGIAVWIIFSLAIGQKQSMTLQIITQKTWSDTASGINKTRAVNAADISSSFLSKSFWGDKFLNLTDLFIYVNHKNRPTRLFDFYKLTIPGSLGFITSFFFIIAVIKFVIKPDNKRFQENLLTKSWLIIGPAFFTILFHGFYIRTGVMSYLLGITPLLLLFISKFYSTRFFAVISIFSISESLYLLFIKDDLSNQRLSLFNQNTYYTLSIIFFTIVFFVSFVLYLSNRRHRNLQFD